MGTYIASKIPKISCLLCKSELAVNMFDRHYGTKQCLSGGKFHISYYTHCKFCNLEFSKEINIGNHIRWCVSNPMHKTYKENASKNLKDINFDRKFHPKSEEMKQIVSDKIKDAHKRGAYENANFLKRELLKDFRHTEETKEKLRESALKANYQRVCKSTHEYIDKNGRTFKFDSKWEDALADRLDELDFNWTRPEPIKWIDGKGKSRNYFPDFYLPDYDLYLDPKNSYCMKQQEEKIRIISSMVNLIILPSLKECKTFNVNGLT